MDILIVIDMQNDFISGPLGTKESNHIIKNVKRRIDLYKTNKQPVIFTQDTHYNNYLSTYEGKNLPIEHCIKNTSGWFIFNEIDDLNSTHICKNSFGYNNWKDVINEEIQNYYKNLPYNTVSIRIELVGLCTDICVISNALILRSLFPEIDIYVNESCCAGTTIEKHKAAIDVMKSCQIKIINE